MMKLVEILAREMDEWPEGASLVVQDYNGNVKYQYLEDLPEIYNGAVWIRTLSDEPGAAIVGRYKISIDRDTAVITREMWEAERAKLDRVAERDVARLIVLLEHAQCPNCDGSGARYGSHSEPEQCQWCHERAEALAAHRSQGGDA